MTQRAEPHEGRVRRLVDPAWMPSTTEPDPPGERVAGWWTVASTGRVGRFEANPDWRPLGPDSPSDPVDAALLRVRRDGEVDGDELVAVLGDVVLGVAVDDDGSAIVVPAPDDVPAVVVTTVPFRRAVLDVAGWREATLAELAAALPGEGVDVLVNPGSPVSMRLFAGTVRAVARGEL